MPTGGRLRFGDSAIHQGCLEAAEAVSCVLNFLKAMQTSNPKPLKPLNPKRRKNNWTLKNR